MGAKRLDDLRIVDPVLSTIAQTWSNDLFLSETLFPSINVRSAKGKIPIFGKDAFILRETERAIRSNSNRIPAGDYELTSYETQERDIEMAIDYMEAGEAMNYEKYEQRITKELRDVLALGREQEIAEYLQDPNQYQTWQKKVLSAADAINSASSSVDPLETILNAKEKIRENIGRYPNHIVTNTATLRALQKNSAITEITNKFTGLVNIVELLKDLIGIENISVCKSVLSEDSKTFKDVWGNNILLAYVDSSAPQYRSEYNPSLGYIFRMEGMPEVDVYYENGGKVKVVRCTDNYCWKVTAPAAAFLIANTIA
jgi:hypothetical protein